ncbi:MAG: Coenzyme F420 hydrogenase/dehydrogenase, beta subunit C-terminal domain [Candidatus Lokiarchaeota archaeon]|nr:Coenzyme F420 hydrogenase/dehydrogenase, beta subunit C-terminal domain [Candidatus Lokiarchaeota archaeon]
MTEEKEKQEYDYSFDYISRKLEGKKDSYGMLMKEIVRTGICTQCGTCAAVCSVLEWDHATSQPKLIGKCTGCGICYNQCPRTITDPIELMGEFKTGYSARTNIPEVIDGQDGGTVVSILSYLFDEHLIDAAIVTMKNPKKPWYPMAKIATSKEEIIKSAGSVYAHSQTVEALMEAIRKDFRSIAFVGTPCNINAVDKMMSSPAGMLKYFMRAHILKIGLFCMDSFSPETLYARFEKDGIDISKITKMDINKGKFHLYETLNSDPVKSYTIASLHRYKSSSCNFCTDLTAEKADISIGSVGSGPGKNTVFARTGLGTEIVEDAAKKGYINVDPFESINLNAVLFLAKLKKVTQYNIQKRKVFILKEGEETTKKGFESGPITDKAKSLIGTRKTLSLGKDLNEKTHILNLTLTNTVGFTLENITARIALVEDVFEKNPWVATLKELFPFEELEIGYPVENLEGTVLVEVSTEEYGKIFSRSIKFAPAEK